MKNFADHIQEIENNLPLDAKYKNPKLGALAPIRVVNEVLATGDGAHGVRTAAFNLPNDERIVKAMGSKRVMLKNVQEAKADVTGLFMLQYLFDHKLLPANEKALYTTFLASSFRTLRFGVHEAHGRGMALQFNYLADKGAFVAKADGTFAIDSSKIKSSVRDLVHDLLDIEATGDYPRAKKMLDTLGVIRPAMEKALDKLKDLPVDIEPVRPTGI